LCGGMAPVRRVCSRRTWRCRGEASAGRFTVKMGGFTVKPRALGGADSVTPSTERACCAVGWRRFDAFAADASGDARSANGPRDLKCKGACVCACSCSCVLVLACLQTCCVNAWCVRDTTPCTGAVDAVREPCDAHPPEHRVTHARRTLHARRTARVERARGTHARGTFYVEQ
jgi:hypothetical protein